MSSTTTEVVLDYGSPTQLGEGLFYNHEKGNLLWVDILGNRVYRYSFPGRRLTEWKVDHLGKYPSTFLPISSQTRNSKGIKQQFMISFQNSLHFWDPITNTSQEALTLPYEGTEPTFRFNDGKCDPSGRLWLGTMDLHDRPNRAGLFRLNSNGSFDKKLDASLSNGLGWSPDGSIMYYIDTPERKVNIFQYDQNSQDITGQIDEIDLVTAKGKPDGMTVDNQGHLWIAMWDGNSVLRIDPHTKQCIEQINLSVSRPTNCVIGGPNMNQLFVSSAKVDNEPNSGRVMLVQPRSQVLGVPCPHLSF